MYDLILFNNATKKAYAYTGLTDTGEKLYYRFDGFDPGDIPTGEYTYALIFNELGILQYEFKNSPMDTLIHFDGATYRLGDLSPEIGLLKYLSEDNTENAPVYRDTEKEFYYRKK